MSPFSTPCSVPLPGMWGALGGPGYTVSPKVPNRRGKLPRHSHTGPCRDTWRSLVLSDGETRACSQGLFLGQALLAFPSSFLHAPNEITLAAEVKAS